MTHNTILAAAATVALVMAAGCERAADHGTTNTPATSSNRSNGTAPARAPDNTARNQTDRNSSTITPPDQSESADDVRITADVRRAIQDDKSMSMNAQNCKIVTQGGVVTLRGPVESDAERTAIEAKAQSVSGVKRVDNQLEVKPG